VLGHPLSELANLTSDLDDVLGSEAIELVDATTPARERSECGASSPGSSDGFSLQRSNLELARVALDAGYYDQPHMNAEFREMAGLTPRQFRAGRRYPETPGPGRPRLAAYGAVVSQPANSRGTCRQS
jgi:hypothetical protein